MLHHFPLALRSFSTMPCHDDPRYNNSVDVYLCGKHIKQNKTTYFDIMLWQLGALTNFFYLHFLSFRRWDHIWWTTHPWSRAVGRAHNVTLMSTPCPPSLIHLGISSLHLLYICLGCVFGCVWVRIHTYDLFYFFWLYIWCFIR
jgi:hypothetical protein